MVKLIKEIIKGRKVELTLSNVAPLQMSIKKMPSKGIRQAEHLECLRDILRLCKETDEWVWFTAKELAVTSRYAGKIKTKNVEGFLLEDLKEMEKLDLLENRDNEYKVTHRFLEVFRRNINNKT